MPEVLRGGQGFSTAKPQKGDIIIRRSRGGRSSRTRTPSVIIKGDTVKIDGVGYSVAPSLQADFIRQRTGGRGSSAQAAMKAAAKAAAEATAIKAAEQKRIEEAKSFAEKMRIAKEIVMSRQAKSELQRILNFRSNLIKRGATEYKVMSTDAKTGDKLEVSQWRDKYGNRTERIKNLDKGTTTYSTFEKPKRGPVRKTGGVSMGSIAPIIKPQVLSLADKVKIIPSSDPNKVVVTLPNGLKGFVNKIGRVVVGAAKAGHKYIFDNGKILSIDGINIFSEQRKRSKLVGEIVKDVASVVTKKTWNFIKKVNKKLTLKGTISSADKKRLTSELSKLESKPILSKRDKNIKKDIIEILDRGEIKILRGEVDLGGRAISGKLIANFPSYAKLFSKAGKDFGKVGKGNIIKEINTLKDFRQGQLAQAYLKAKNAQLKDLSFGSFVTIGGKPSSRILNVLNKKLRQINIDPKDVTLSKYLQSFKVTSNIPKTEALIKILKTGKMFTKKQLNKIPKFYDFKREGVLVTKRLPNGNVKVVAMEYNRVGNKISHISYKIGVGSDTFAVIDTFKKIRKLSTIKGIRVKHTGSAVVKSKVISKKKLSDDVEKTISQLKTKKVFLNGKRLNKKEIKFFEDMLKSQTQDVMSKRLGNIISKLYKKSPDYNISGISNVVRIKRTLNKIIIKSGKKKGKTQGVSRIGDFLEIGFTKKRLASDRKVKLIGKARISPVAARRVAKLKAVDKQGKIKIDETISIIGRNVSMSSRRLVKLEIKKGITATQSKNIENAVKSIQTIVRPTLRSSSASLTKTQVNIINSNVKKILPGLSKSSKTAIAVLNKSLMAVQQIKKLVKTPVQEDAIITLTKSILGTFSGLKPVPIRTFRKPPITPTPRPYPRPIPRRPPTRPLKKPPIIPIKLKKKRNTRTLSKKVMGYAFMVKREGKLVKLKLPPLTLRDAWDVGSYRLDHQLQRTGRLVATGMVDEVAKISKSVKGYYGKNQKKFRRVRIKKGKVLSLDRTIIEKKKYIGDTASELKKLHQSRKKVVKRKEKKVKTVKRVSASKKLLTLNQLKSKKVALISKRKRMINKLKNR